MSHAIRSPRAVLSTILRVARRIIVQRPEDNPSVRLIALAMGVWVAASLSLTGSPLWIWTGGAAALGAGHGVSWFLRDSRSPIRSIAVALALIGAIALTPRTVALAARGDWMPSAYYLLLFQVITSFELRTRGGLYASIGISGGILLFVSQRAIGPGFGIFLTGFATLVLAFLAVTFLVDQVRQAEVHWFRNRFSFAWFWSGVLIVSLTTSIGVFLLLPKEFGDPLSGAQAVVLPVRASGSSGDQEVIPRIGPLDLALPISPEEVDSDSESAMPDEALQEMVSAATSPSSEPAEGGGPESSTESEAATASEAGQGAPEPPLGPAPADADAGLPTDGPDVGEIATAGGNAPIVRPEISGTASGSGNGVEEPGAGGSPPSAGSSEQPAWDGEAAAPNSVVMNVRSPALTYWRGRAFDTFDGQSWKLASGLWTAGSDGSDRRTFVARDALGVAERPRYAQTYFLEQTLPPDTILTGYSPVVASVPRLEDGRSLEEGTIYRVISALPDFSADRLSEQSLARGPGMRYLQVPPSLQRLSIAAELITEGVAEDVERMRLIITYLNRTHGFDREAADQLTLSASPIEFVVGAADGTSMDFATATALLGRAAGIPTRVVTGYIPGRFDPLSGTYVVRARDRHAWAEMYVDGAGWVPFDGAPKPEFDAFLNRRRYRVPVVGSLFGTAYADDIYRSVRASPSWVVDLMGRVLDGGATRYVFGVLAVILASTDSYFAWRLSSRLRSGKRRTKYTRLTGGGRAEMLRIYSAAEKLLRNVGLPRRAPSQTLAEYAAGVEPALGIGGSHLSWLRNAAWAAAYDPKPDEAGELAEAKDRLRRLKSALMPSR